MIYVDVPTYIPKEHATAPRVFLGAKFSHITADTEEELVAYVTKLGMKASWIQRPGTPYFHFDLTGKYLRAALADPDVQRITPRDFIQMIKGRKGPATPPKPELTEEA